MNQTRQYEHRSIPPPFVVGLILSAAIAGLAFSAELREFADPELQACVERIRPQQSMTQIVGVKVFDRNGAVNYTRAKFSWKRFSDDEWRTLFRFTDPPRRAGTAVLIMEKQNEPPVIYVYLPELRQVRRITGQAMAGSMFGTDFSYEDFTHMQDIASNDNDRRIEDQTIDGRPAYAIETTPSDEDSDYSRIVTYVDKEDCIPVRSEFIAHSGELHKELTAPREDIRQVGDRRIPYRLVMTDHKEQSRTELVVEQIAFDPELRDSLFTTAELRSGRH
jgi:outer membrane lipoprotein-sorting protein